MPTLFPPSVDSAVFDFAVALASAARLFTVVQVARHSDMAWRTDPARRTRELLRAHAGAFEHQGRHWRLTRRERQNRGILWRPVSPMTQRADHWIGIGDIWCALTFAGGRPSEWRTEWDRQFDVYMVWSGVPFLIEYQRTPITSKQWAKKWEQRIEWYRAQEWKIRPRVVLVDVTHQTDETIGLPRGTIHVRNICDLPRAVRKSRTK